MNCYRIVFTIYTLILTALCGLSSCASFYTSPAAQTPTFEKPEELQTTFYRSESGMAVDATVSFKLPEQLKSVDYSLPTDKMLPFASFQLYDHVRNVNDSSDLRDQTEFDASIGLFGREGSFHFGAAIGFAGGEIDVDYTRTKIDTVILIFPFLRSTSQHVEGTYMRPHFDLYGGIGGALSPLPMRLEVGAFERLHLPFFLTCNTSDSALDTSALIVELGAYARLTLLDLIAVEWRGGVGLPIIGSDWYYEYGTLGVGLILGR
ncbi:MAG: hypothetical protein AB7H80_02625 [Candidatus Kapaibacterium sp.]